MENRLLRKPGDRHQPDLLADGREQHLERGGRGGRFKANTKEHSVFVLRLEHVHGGQNHRDVSPAEGLF